MRYLVGFLGGVIVATTVSVFAQWGNDPVQQQMEFQRQMQMYQGGQSIINDGGIAEQQRRAGLQHRNPC